MILKSIGSKPNSAVVELCQELLDDAKSGKVRGVAIATVEAENVLGTCFESGDAAVLSLLGSVAVLKHEVIAEGFEHG
jgi:GTPase